MRRLVVWLAIVSVGGLLLPATAAAQGSISGLVEDTTGGILPGVTVEADSPVNIEGTITAITDGAGRYTIINLRPGTYTVTFTLPGFNTFVREGIMLIGAAVVQVPAQLAVGAIEETVTVSGASPVVDVQQVRNQFVATREMMDVLPAGRSFAARALLIPGVRNTGMDAGTYWPTVHGSTWKDAQTMNDGMRANSTVDDGQWQMGWEMNDAATAEITFEAGGAPAEVQVGGVIQNAIPKEGGNTFSGTLFSYYGGEGFASSNADAELRDLLGEVNRLAYDYDVNLAFGGRLIRDKLWFFGSFRGQDTKTYEAGSFFAEAGQPCRPVTAGFFGPVETAIGCVGQADNGLGEPGSQAFTRTYGISGLMRLTHQVTDRHKWRISFDRVNRQHPLADAGQDRPPESANRIMQPSGYHTQVRWTSSLTNRLLVEAGFSVQYNKWRREQFDWNANNSSTFDLATGTWGGGFWITGQQPEKSRYLNASASYVTGSHNFKAGFEHRWGTLGLEQTMPADVRTYFYFSVPNVIQLPIGVMVLATPVGNYEGQINFDTGLYAQDSWTLDKWTLNLGVRADLFKSSVPEQFAAAGTWVPERSFPAFPGPRWNTIVARLGVAYDLFGDGRTALKGSMHQYVSSEATRLAMERNPLSSFTWSAAQEFRSWNDLDGNQSVVAADGRIQREEVGPSPNVNFGTANDVITLDLDREGNWEYNAQIQHELFTGISTSFGWYRRNYYNMWHEDNRLQDRSDFTSFNFQGPTDDRLGANSGQSLTLWNLNPGVFGLKEAFIVNSDRNDSIYDGFEFVMDGRLSNGAFFGGSFTTERSKINSCDVSENPGDEVLWLNNTVWCDAPRTWQTLYKAYGAYPLPGDVIVSAFIQGYPGPDIDAIFNVTSLPDGTDLTGGGTFGVDLLPPDTLFLPYQRKLDIRVARRFIVGNMRINPVFDVFNLLNANTTTDILSTFGPRWQEIEEIMQARFVRIGLEIDW